MSVEGAGRVWVGEAWEEEVDLEQGGGGGGGVAEVSEKKSLWNDLFPSNVWLLHIVQTSNVLISSPLRSVRFHVGEGGGGGGGGHN